MKLLYKIYPDLREVDINKFIHFLLNEYVKEQDLQHFNKEQYEELAQLMAGTIIDFLGGYMKITGQWNRPQGLD